MYHLDTGLLGDLGANVSWDWSTDFTGDFVALLMLFLSSHLGALLSGNVLTVFFLHLKNNRLCSTSVYTACHKRTKATAKKVITYKTAFLLPEPSGGKSVG